MRDVVSTLSFSSSSSSFPICAIIIRNRFDSASTVACIRSRERMYVQEGVCRGVSKLNRSLRIISRKEERDGFTPFLRNM